MSAVLAYVSAVMIAVWGVLHAIPTRQVIAGFEPVTADNRRVILQEWLGDLVQDLPRAAIGSCCPAASRELPVIRRR
jgi:hypothetical protein